MPSSNQGFLNYSFQGIVDTLIRLGVLYFLFAWCFKIMMPFQLILIWGTLIALAVYPVYIRISKLFGGRKNLAALFITFLLLSIIIIPGWFLSESIIKSLSHLRELYIQGNPIIPHPGETTKTWPPITKPLVDLWQLSSENLHDLLIQYRDKFEKVGTWLLKTLGELTMGVLQFVGSIILACVMLIYSEAIGKSMFKLFKKLAGNEGESFAKISVDTVRSVFKGVLLVSFLQAALAGIGFYIAGIPHAGLWTVACLVLAIVQVGIFPVAIPAVIYMFTASGNIPAVFFSLWMIVVSLSDNFIKPFLMGTKSSTPVMVIFIGSIGGMISAGIMGLFLGAVILSVGYKLLISWLNTEIQN